MNPPNQPGQPPMTMPPNSAPNPAMNMLGSQNPNPQQRFSIQMPPGNPMQHRQMMVRPGGPDGQPMNPAMQGLPHTQMQGMNMPPGANSLAARRAVSQPQLSQAPLGHMGMNPQTSMPAQVRAVMGRPNAMPPDNMRQGPMHIMPGPGVAQPPGGMGNPANFPNVHQPPLSSSPRPGGPHPPGPPNMGPGGQHMNRASVGGDEFMYQNFPPGPSNRNPNQFNFNPSSPPPMNEMSNMGNPSAPNRPSFQPTPVDQYKVLHPESNYPPFAIQGRQPPNAPIPPRPPSINQPPSQQTPSQPPHHAPSPHASPMYPPQRPPSRPSSRTAGPPHRPQTPRSIPPQGPQPPSRLPSNPQPPVHQQPGGGPQPIAPRPPQGGPSIPGSSPSATAGQSPEHQQAQPQQQQQAGPNLVTVPRSLVHPLLGSGQALTRLLQFSGNLSSESPSKYRLSWWQELITEYFTPKAVMKLTLWKDNQRQEAKPFEIGVPILPRFFLVTTQSGVKSMTLSLDGARERMYANGHAIVECVTAIWTYRYKNGYIVTLRGPLTAHVIVTSGHPPGTQSLASHNGIILKFEDFSFDANFHDKYIALDSITGQKNPMPNDLALSPTTPRMRNAQGIGLNGNTISDEDRYWEEPRLRIDGGSIPGEPVNAFGIPQATMRCLELAESVAQMADLITFADETKEGPIEALTKYANKLLEAQGQPPIGIQPIMNGMSNGQPHPSLPFAPPFSNVSATLYSSAPSSVANPSSAPTTSTMSSPQNAPPSAQNSPQKQHKTIPQPSVPSGTSNSNPVATAATPGSTHNTPAMTTATLKRKQPSDPSPPTTESNPTKRVTRAKRGRGAGG